MPLDPRSRARLEALGRSLPKPLPAPEPPRSSRAEASAPRHAVETEQNPEQLFRELMAASADGTVPPHLLDRLRQLEKERLRSRPLPAPSAQEGLSNRPSAPASQAATAGRRSSPRRRDGGVRPGGRAAAAGSEEADLYTAFAQLLLEDEGLD